jgi:hypothetical protein
MASSNMYQTADNKTLRKALHEVNSFQNITLGKTLTQCEKTSHMTSVHQAYSAETNSQPHHVRE